MECVSEGGIDKIGSLYKEIFQLPSGTT